MKKEEKVTAVAELTEKFGRARLAILTECVGLPVNEVTELRKQLRGAKAEYRIVKNTLAARAAEGTVLADVPRCPRNSDRRIQHLGQNIRNRKQMLPRLITRQNLDGQ